MVDVTFDCRDDAKGRDPDSHSPTLRRFHQFLWSKALPGGQHFHLDISGPRPFLVHRSELGEFHLTSDSITHAYSLRPTVMPLVRGLPTRLREFAENRAWPVSECTLFPGKLVDGKPTINGARGMHRWIGDRFDLTLECIRRHYRGEPSPLAEALARYSSFFALFDTFEGYLDFFLLQDLVDERSNEVKFYLPFQSFGADPLPRDLESYTTYLEGVTAFAFGRGQRMEVWCRQNPVRGSEEAARPFGEPASDRV